MFTPLTVIVIALGYVGVLFAIASYRDRTGTVQTRGTSRPFTYALSIAVYCTSWTFFGSVGLSAKTGFDFLPIYIGPILMFAVGWPLLRAIVDVSKRQNITSIADFVSARYGKNQALGAFVALIAVIGVVPYISLQLKAVAASLQTLMPSGPDGQTPVSLVGFGDDLALLVTAAMAGFAVLFGTRHIDTTEHQDGLMLAIAVESIVKLLAFLVIGTFVTFWLMGGIGPLLERAQSQPEVSELFSRGFDGGRWITMTLLAMCAILLLPRQFHVTVVENSHLDDVRRAAWMFPLYLIVINLFVVPIAIAGLLTFGSGTTDADTFVLALPVNSGHRLMVIIAFIGGLSAATAMVIVETIALSIMVCNNIVMPFLLSRRDAGTHLQADAGRTLIAIRRWAIVIILILAYSYYELIGSSAALAQTGLLSFAAVAQFAPAFFGGLLWRGATARGAMAGILAGFALWAYTLLLPTFADAGWLAAGFVSDGPFGLGFLRPRMLFNLEFDPLTHGVLWSLGVNVITFVSVSIMSWQTPIERLQASVFVSADLPTGPPSFRLWRGAVSVGELQETVARYLGKERAHRSFEEFAFQRGVKLKASADADIRMMRFAEHLLASAVGAASSRLVLALLLERHAANTSGAMRLLDDATAAIQYNRDQLQSAIDHVRQGIAVFDRELTLVSWNRQFRHLLNLPGEMGRVGITIDEILAHVVKLTGEPADAFDRAIRHRIDNLTVKFEPFQERLAQDGTILEVRSSQMPEGGFVITFADITERVLSAEELQRVNETLERRVGERTAELLDLNSKLQIAKRDADAANLDKTRFLAAASHDILQPLNAARLFTSSLVERKLVDDDRQLVRNVDASLEAVEEILNALLDISRLDAGAMKPEITSFRIDSTLRAMALEFSQFAEDKGLRLVVMPCSITVTTDRKLLRRILQNLISNALKYTREGRVLVGCRRCASQLRIDVIDTGPGISLADQATVFAEFERLVKRAHAEPGLGLGLSIVQRIARVLEHELTLVSVEGSGARFSISLPVADVQVPDVVPLIRPGGAANVVSGRKVMVIDNEPAILAGMRNLLTGWGCEVQVAVNGSDAKAAALKTGWNIDIILADYHLDREDGLAVIEMLRHEAGRPIPAVLITADRTRQVQDRAAGQDVIYMHKPVKPASLRAAMAHGMTRAQAAE